MPVLTENVEKFLATRGIHGRKSSGPEWIKIALDPAPGADFALYIYTHPDESADIGAARIGASEGEYFFSRTYEPVDFSDNVETLTAALIGDIDLLISNPIRIHRQDGLLLKSFNAEINTGTATKWLYGSNALRWGFNFPPSEKDRVYQSPALVSGKLDG